MVNIIISATAVASNTPGPFMNPTMPIHVSPQNGPFFVTRELRFLSTCSAGCAIYAERSDKKNARASRILHQPGLL